MQVVVEYWVVATRPKSANGIGLSVKDTDSDVADFLQLLPRIPEPTDIFERWRRLVSSHEVSGRPAHDARLVALMQAHGLEEILTLNHRDFERFDGIRCLNPQVLS